jgi:short-subunit dehydrogenase
MDEIADLAVMVTGASAGIGEALALRLAAQGARLGLVGRDPGRLADVVHRCGEHGVDVASWVCDLGDLDAAGALGMKCWERFDGVDVLVNNAAMPKRRHVLELTEAELDEVMRVNFLSPVRLATALLPLMIERGRGCVVNVSSLGGRLGILNESAYSASKFALTGWTEAAALDLWDEPVEIRLITPGAIDTSIWSRPDNDPADFVGELEPPDTVADAILQAIIGGPFETYTPDMSAVVEFKMADIDAFQRGTIEALRPEPRG